MSKVDIVNQLKNLKEYTTRLEAEKAQALVALREAFGVSSLEDALSLMDRLQDELEELKTKRKAIEDELDKFDWGNK